MKEEHFIIFGHPTITPRKCKIRSMLKDFALVEVNTSYSKYVDVDDNYFQMEWVPKQFLISVEEFNFLSALLHLKEIK